MAHLYFNYGTVASGKSTELLRVAHNYKIQGKKILTYCPAIDTRSGIGKIKSRLGMEKDVIPIEVDTDIFKDAALERPVCILVDEANFLTKEHVIQLAEIVDKLKIPVMAYGLKNTFASELFEGSYYLLIHADKIREIKTVCYYCDRKATHVLRIEDNKPVFAGDTIKVDGDGCEYTPVCRGCWFKRKGKW